MDYLESMSALRKRFIERQTEFLRNNTLSSLDLAVMSPLLGVENIVEAWKKKNDIREA
jgi:hypothetical protein